MYQMAELALFSTKSRGLEGPQGIRVFVVYTAAVWLNPIVVFDGYDEISTKNMTQQRRAAAKLAQLYPQRTWKLP